MTDEFKFDTSQITTLDERFGKCPYATAQSLISGKWAPPILLYLSDGPIRFNELQRRMPKMTHATLSVQLKSLVENGLVERTQYEDIPPHVEYSLTEIGEKYKCYYCKYSRKLLQDGYCIIQNI